MRVAINCDLGESYGHWTLGSDGQMMDFITSANIACGFHAGDPHHIRETVHAAVNKRVGIGAHPSYPDRQGFGRRFMDIPPAEVADIVTYQIGALQGFVRAGGGRLEHVKLHGALYHRAMNDRTVAEAVIEGVRRIDAALVVVVSPGTVLEEAARSHGMPFVREVFADRGYGADGQLLPRAFRGGVLRDADEIARRMWIAVSERRIQTAAGRWLPIRADTICVHGDTDGAVAIARALRDELRRRGVTLTTIGQLVQTIIHRPAASETDPRPSRPRATPRPRLDE